MSVPAALVEAVAAAIERLSRPGIEGWGLVVSRDMREAGDVLDLGVAPRRRWVPKSGRLVELGSDEEPGELQVRYYAHIDGDTLRYIRIYHPRFGWAVAEYVEAVPDWALARLASGAAV